MNTRRRIDAKKELVVFILTHGRAKTMQTHKTLAAQGWSGRTVFVIDDEDAQGDMYRTLYGAENVVAFSKEEVAKTFDEVCRGDRKTIVYARNACFEIAKKLGFRYFLELDDDYTFFAFTMAGGVPVTRGKNTKRLNDVFSAVLTYYASMPRCKSIALSQGGDFIGGVKAANKQMELKRKAMNSFFCDTERPFTFTGRINEDVNTYTMNATRGDLFFTIMQFSLNQQTTQKNKGGMTDVYMDSGTYVKSFFSVIVCPSAVKVGMMGDKHKRMHHVITWKNCTPKIISEKYRKL
jgi:hypothetical protein